MSEENARKAFHPGRTLEEVLASLGMTQKELSERTEISIKHINEIIKHKSPITPNTAVLLEYALGISASFWNNLQTSYEVSIARNKLLEEKKEEIELVRSNYSFYAELANWGYVEKTSDAETKLENLLSFFGVTSLKNVDVVGSIQYRKSTGFSKEALAAWLRIGEIEYRQQPVNHDYDPKKLRASLGSLRNMTRNRAEDYSVQLVNALAECGVNLVFTPYIKKSKVNGATRWVSGNQPIIQISTRFKSNDILWFTIFHELGHILKHGKKEKFIEVENIHKDDKEKEADLFAANTLIPEAAYKSLLKESLTKQKIKDFADDLEISPDIVSGRLAKDKHISWPDHQQHFARRISLQPVA